jgi:hypothetical protein
MADYTDSKNGLGSVVHENEIDNDWTDLGPIITPEKLRRVHLFGIPLVSNIRDPITKRVQVMDDTLIKEFINEASSLAETESKLKIFPRQIKEKQAFDRAAYDQFGYMQLRQRPIASIEALTVTPSNEVDIFNIPLEWVDCGLLHLGQLNLIPLTISTKAGAVVPMGTSPGGATFLSIFGSRPWLPLFFEIKYTVGFPNGLVSKIVNQYIGCIAAMEILSVLAATYSRSNSTSLGIDGLSQSISTPGMELFKVRMEELSQKRKWILGRLQAAYNMHIIVDNV